MPFAVAGALGFVAMRGLENDIYFQIGLVVLIGLAAKNAILIVEFAQQGFLEGKSAAEAALNAARLRFRPIVMTSLAFVLGVLPLMIATGAGAGARRSRGTGVGGGMRAATFIATIFVPLLVGPSPAGDALFPGVFRALSVVEAPTFILDVVLAYARAERVTLSRYRDLTDWVGERARRLCTTQRDLLDTYADPERPALKVAKAFLAKR